ncbi:uncharacterized protein BP5553_01773 [Venustampulla echinocandica]|uniref:Six-hairpin glycosidase n=1 Tax=Venustampulla echinocandica TaxID=2656787 RepID=A0A370U1Z0_9HELO|nr:uncharacterized protein BP5553_01773 [Venustampulla echinocandica]RDL41794.1 hypothetical protein BP5553_01773 [Venustampulla echinocandica]
MEKLLERMKGVVKDPDPFWLFENSYPNTLDTMIKWRGYAKKIDPETKNETVTDEESFQPPPESGVNPTDNGAVTQNNPQPSYNPVKVFDCKWELDSLASFLQISTAYYERTKDLNVFQKYDWIEAVKAAVDAAGAMRLGTYAPEGKVEKSAWTFTGWTNRSSETLTNDGLGNPTKGNGMVRSAFRPSDDACIYQLLVPANMMFAKYLEQGSLIMEKLEGDQVKNLTTVMRDFALGISVPSLLSIPLFSYANSSFPFPEPAKGDPKRDHAQIYKNTRDFILSDSNPYFAKGPALSAIGGPHLSPGKGWPMAAIIRALSAFRIGLGEKKLEEEVKGQLSMALNSTGGTGVIHESVNAWNAGDWTRAWFRWANGLLGELVLKIDEEKKEWLAESWQD